MNHAQTEARRCKGIHGEVSKDNRPHNLGKPGVCHAIDCRRIGLDGMYGRENLCEWIYSCYGMDAGKALRDAIRNRHHHTGYMSWYREMALPLVMHAIEHEKEPIFASWF